MHFSSLLTLSSCVAASSVKGVAPEDQHLYQPDSEGFFSCVSDPSIKIPISRVNDDYCDCPDGSDEPGTSACSNGKFYCVGSKQYIPSKLVGDGACDYDVCCDGSDEAPGVCEDRCAQVQAKREAEEAAHREFLAAGSSLRAELAKKAQARRSELDASVKHLTKRIAELTPQLQTLESQIDAFGPQAEQVAASAPASRSLKSVRDAIIEADSQNEELRDSYNELKSAYAVLDDALAKMSVDYNPNFNDPAVKAAIKTWKAAAKPEPRKFYANAHLNDDELELIEAATLEGASNCALGKLEYLTAGAKQYYANLRSAVASPQGSIVTALTTNPFSSAALLSGAASSGPSVGVLRLTRLKEERDAIKSELSSSEHQLKINEKLSAAGEEFWGKDSVGLSLEDTCVRYKRNDFYYKVCLFGGATQKSGPHIVDLGHSTGLTQDTKGKYYIDFVRGDKCQNGKFRSTRLWLECGHTTEAFSVSEPEMCQYELKGVSPLAC